MERYGVPRCIFPFFVSNASASTAICGHSECFICREDTPGNTALTGKLPSQGKNVQQPLLLSSLVLFRNPIAHKLWPDESGKGPWKAPLWPHLRGGMWQFGSSREWLWERVLCLTWIRNLLFLDISASVVFFNFAVTWRPSRRRQWHPTAVLLPGKSMDGGAW